MLPVTGQRPVSRGGVVTSHEVVVTEQDLLNPSHPVNDTNISGKKRGSYVVVERQTGELEFAIATGDGKEDPWELHTAPVEFQTGVDVYTWSGTQAISANSYFNLISLPLNKTIDVQVSSIEDDLVHIPPYAGQTSMVVVVRLTGTTASGGATEWRVQIRRPDGNAIVSSVESVRLSNALNINYRENSIQTYTNTETDPYSVDGFQVGVQVPGGQMALTLTGVSIRILRMPN